STELYGILSSLSETPITQIIAVNRLGQSEWGNTSHWRHQSKDRRILRSMPYQGFHGRTGSAHAAVELTQPNAPALLVDAVIDGRYHIHAIGTVDEGTEVLTGMAAVERNSDGHYPADSINERVERKLAQFSEQQKQFAAAGNFPRAAAQNEDWPAAIRRLSH